MKLLVTGGCGYKGHVLVPKLLAAGHTVYVVDIQWFGNKLTPHERLYVIQGDVRNIDRILLEGVDAILHLASVANDPCGDLDPQLTWEISTLATMQLAEKAKRAGVKQFLYASSGSVYGVKSEPQVVETLELDPISGYNKTKMVAERVLMSYEDTFAVQMIRPGTVCGYSPRMRFDVVVNMMVIQAMTHGKMTVLGGDQIRPNIHIDDIADVYLFFLANPHLTGIYNASFENLSVLEIAERVARYVPASIEVKPSNDPRSYRMNSDKLLGVGFRPKKSVDDAIRELVSKIREGQCRDEDQCYNVRWMQQSMGVR